MAMAAFADSTAIARAASVSGRIASVDVIADMAVAEPIWRRLEDVGALMTPYQRFAFQDAWHRHVGAQDGTVPFIVVAYDADHQPVMLLPLGVRSERGIRVARFFGGKHVSFNMALWRRDVAATVTKDDLDTILQQLREQRDGADVLALIRQPNVWNGAANPLALLPHQASTNDCPLLILSPGQAPADRISNSFRRRLKGKERKLQALPGYSYSIARDDAAITRALDAFFAIKPLRMAEQKLPDVFADPGIEPFIRDACRATAGGGRAIDIHALQCDDEVIAIFAGVADGKRFSMMFNTYTLSASSKFSPGLILMRDIIDHYAAAGATALDLGVGSDDYKRLFCKDDQPIFDSYLPLSARGSMAATAMSSLTRIKRLVKHNPPLMQAAQALRGALRR